MELRKDPITRSWVRIGHGEQASLPPGGCPLCPERGVAAESLLALSCNGAPQVRVTPHFNPIYRIEFEPSRAAEGIYDYMRPVGAHEIVIHSPDHAKTLGSMSDSEIACVLDAYAQRLTDLKRDVRFKYVTVFHNRGALAGAEWEHSYSEITATTFVPRRMLYELRSARTWFEEKERCVYCDILRQEERQEKRVVDTQGEYVAFCPFASRVPFEIWLMGRKHNHLFEKPLPGSNRRQFAALLGRTLRRLDQISKAYHLVLHTAPSTVHPKGELASYWRTLVEDFHWHVEILPIVEQRSKSYSIKEIYFNAVPPEQAAKELRQLNPST